LYAAALVGTSVGESDAALLGPADGLHGGGDGTADGGAVCREGAKVGTAVGERVRIAGVGARVVGAPVPPRFVGGCVRSAAAASDGAAVADEMSCSTERAGAGVDGCGVCCAVRIDIVETSGEGAPVGDAVVGEGEKEGPAVGGADGTSVGIAEEGGQVGATHATVSLVPHARGLATPAAAFTTARTRAAVPAARLAAGVYAQTVEHAPAYAEPVQRIHADSINARGTNAQERDGGRMRSAGAPHALQSVITQSTHGRAAHASASCVLQSPGAKLP
jgi:hypothetical protein